MSDEISQVKNLIEAQGKAWEAFKATNDELVKAKADGKAVGELTEKLAKIEKDLDCVTEMRAQIDKIEAKGNRPAAAVEDGDVKAETKSFNIQRRAQLQNAPERDLTTEEYSAYKSAFWSFARKGRLESLSDGERKAMLAGDDSNGGYLLPTPTVGRVEQKIFELSPIR